MSFLLVQTTVHRNHVYRALWELRVGDSSIALYRSGYEHNRHMRSVNPDEEPGDVVNHLPRQITEFALDELGDMACLSVDII